MKIVIIINILIVIFVIITKLINNLPTECKFFCVTDSESGAFVMPAHIKCLFTC